MDQKFKKGKCFTMKKVKKILAITMMLTMFISLAACGGKPGASSSNASIPASSISNEEDEFTKKLTQLEYAPGEDVESLYYRSTVADGVVCYEVQVEGETETRKIPVADAVIYVVGDDEECQLVKTHFNYETEGGEPTTIEQYRIFATPSTAKITGGDAGSNSADSSAEPDASSAADGSNIDETENADAVIAEDRGEGSSSTGEAGASSSSSSSSSPSSAEVALR